MIRAGMNHPTNPSVILGLTEGNIVRLKNGQPIAATFKSCGVNLPGRVVIMYGPTEADIENELRQAGAIDNNTRLEPSSQMAQERAILGEYDKILVATVGLPRSGKTTWARSQAWPIVNPDSIRLAIHGQRFIGQAEPFVWATARAMVSALFLAGHKIVILDATMTSQDRRNEWYSKDWATFFKVINTPAEVCLERARAEGDTDIIPVIERMASRFEPLTSDEQLWPEPDNV